MKKLILFFSVLFPVLLYAEDIRIFDFETDFVGKWGTNGNPANNQLNEDHVNFSIADNPSRTGINTSEKVGKFHRLKTGLWWALAWFEFTPVQIEASAVSPKYLHISIYKPVSSTVCIQLRNALGETLTNTGEIKSDEQTKINEWQELVFKITTTGTLGYIEVKPDFVNQSPAGRLEDDIDIYFDEIVIKDPLNPFAGDLPEDFEGEQSLIDENYYNDRYGSFGQPAAINDLTVVENPDKTTVNSSDKCAKLIRKKDGNWWAGCFMKPLSEMTVDAAKKYFHILVYRQQDTPLSLKLENADGNTGDIILPASLGSIGKWVDYVFEVPVAQYGAYDKITFMPDFLQEPAPYDRFANDIEIYFDAIELNNDPMPRGTATRIDSATEATLIQVWVDAGGNLFIHNQQKEPCLLQLFNVLGKRIQMIEAPLGKTIIPNKGLSGIYFLKTNKTTHKLVF
jgi:hypothetical protein